MPIAKVLPQSVFADLIHKVKIRPTVTVHISDSNPAAMIVMRRLVVSAGIVNDPAAKLDSTVPDLVSQRKIVIHFKLVDRA